MQKVGTARKIGMLVNAATVIAPVSGTQGAVKVQLSYLACQAWLGQPERPVSERVVLGPEPGAGGPACPEALPPAAPYPGSGCGTGAPSSPAAPPAPLPPAPAAAMTHN